MKNSKLTKEIVNRWRTLGLTTGIKPNSKAEKNVIETFQCMAEYFINSKDNNWSHEFETMIFPIIRLIYTGEKLTGKKTYSVVSAENLFEILNTVTFRDVIQFVNKNIPKSMTKHGNLILRLVEYKKFAGKPITQVTKDNFTLYRDEMDLLTALLPNAYNTTFDFEAEFVYYIPSYVVFKINEKLKKQKSTRPRKTC